MRRRKLYRLSPRGLAELKSWLLLPVRSSDVLRGSDALMLRFSFMDRVLGANACIAFLENFRDAIAGYLPELESFLAGQRSYDAARLARKAASGAIEVCAIDGVCLGNIAATRRLTHDKIYCRGK
jgi:DNA-binding PadR family transcriptional regulator